ncbi:hypothetical protein [Leifsonia sp. SIMBA_070]|uniref:hypothetical protein n=1 Tax=Leifsonia sp. SIMBA_070 TaxID=3085810 RepID=UPI00397CF661
MFGLIAVFLPLAAVSRPGYTGWVITTLGVSAVFLAVRYRRSGGGAFLSITGGTLGVIGTILCVWSLAAFYVPGSVPPVPNLKPVSASTTEAFPIAGAQPGQVQAPAVRMVPPFEGADVVPGNQLHANLVHVAIAFGAVLQYQQSQGTLPSMLAVQSDGTVTSPGTTYSKIAPYMSIEYGLTPGSFMFTVRDTVSGMAVGVDSSTNRIVDR